MAGKGEVNKVLKTYYTARTFYIKGHEVRIHFHHDNFYLTVYEINRCNHCGKISEEFVLGTKDFNNLEETDAFLKHVRGKGKEILEKSFKEIERVGLENIKEEYEKI